MEDSSHEARSNVFKLPDVLELKICSLLLCKTEKAAKPHNWVTGTEGRVWQFYLQMSFELVNYLNSCWVFKKLGLPLLCLTLYSLHLWVNSVPHFITRHILINVVVNELLTHPEVIHDLDCLLKLYRDVHCNVVVETRAHGQILWEGWPVIFPAWNNAKQVCEWL